jgi:tRNA (guanine-N(7)-)-methyltransferase subunit TRM82
MSRRPSSITITSDDTTILCADKFGDVYALPLLAPPDDGKVEQSETPAQEQPEQIDWLPSATALTVHSGRNRKTLEEQLKKKAKGPAKSKEPMRFKHDLLLGHVSMLTDVVYARANGQSYIITADRDEHIRISRGPPQAHIIEGFCFGHEAFINKMCLTQSGLLVSGGGDDHLFVWNWQNYSLHGKLAIKDTALANVQTTESNSVDTTHAGFKVAVTGIWNLPSSSDVSIAKGRILLFLTFDRPKRLSWLAKESRHC